MMYTFDNTFQVSFLFRDGLIAFVKDDEGLPAIKPIDKNEKLPKPTEMTSFTSSLSHDVIQVRNTFNIFIYLDAYFFASLMKFILILYTILFYRSTSKSTTSVNHCSTFHVNKN